MLKCPACGNQLFKAQPRIRDYMLKCLYATQPYRCISANCWHGYLSDPTRAPEPDKRKQLPCSDELKAKLAIQVLGGQSIYFLSRQYHLSPQQISQWRWHLVNNAGRLFTQTPAKPLVPNEKALIYHLLKQVKQLKQALNIAKSTGS